MRHKHSSASERKLTKSSRVRDKLLSIYRKLYDAFGPQHWWPAKSPLEVMVGAILTQNCNWNNVEKAIANLADAKLLDAAKLLQTPDEQVAQYIRPAGYFNVKTRRLKNFLNYYSTKYAFDVGRMRTRSTLVLRNELLSVDGIGCETADSIMLYALQHPIFVVDAYTRRLLQRHGLIEGDEDYDEIRLLFEANLPQDVRLYNEYHALIVNTGKYYCKKTPDCLACPLVTDLVYANS